MVCFRLIDVNPMLQASFNDILLNESVMSWFSDRIELVLSRANELLLDSVVATFKTVALVNNELELAAAWLLMLGSINRPLPETLLPGCFRSVERRLADKCLDNEELFSFWIELSCPLNKRRLSALSVDKSSRLEARFCWLARLVLGSSLKIQTLPNWILKCLHQQYNTLVMYQV